MVQRFFIRKGVVLGIIFLFVGTCVVPSFESATVGFSQLSSQGNWLYVGGSGPGNFSKIQDAINTASAGDTVYVYDDSAPYLECLFVNITLCLLGENRTTTILNSTAGEYTTIITVNSDDCRISNFTIVLNDGSGVDVYGNHTRLSNLTIHSGIVGWSGIGVHLFTASDSEITDVLIVNAQIGIFLVNSTGGTIARNNIIDPGLNGILAYCFTSSISENTIIGNMDQFTQPIGIYLSGSGNHVSTNMISAVLGNATEGFSLFQATGNIIEGNTLQNTGFVQVHSEANLFVNNTVNNRPLVFLVGQSDAVISYAGQVILVNCTRIIVKIILFSSLSHGVELVGTTDSVIRRCHFSACRYGVYLDESEENLIQNNTISGCEWGVWINEGRRNRVQNNTLTEINYGGLQISSPDTEVSFNHINSCSVGIILFSCSGCIIARNNIQKCVIGVYLELVTLANVTQNTFLNNRLCACVQNSFFNRWTGNYWNKARLFPKIIPGFILIIKHLDPIHYKTFLFPWMNIDWHPASES